MPVPKRKTSRSKRDKRRTHWKLKSQSLSECPQCHQPKLPHRVCPNCGYYGDEQVLEIE